VTWLQLAAVDDQTSARCAGLSKPFSGDASKVSVLIERGSPPAPVEGEEVEDDGEPAPEGYTKVLITEAQRLAYSIAAIDSSCACIPKGAMIMDANENVAPNRSFAGVDGATATDPASYVHFRPVANPKSIVKLGDAADPAADCFESLTDDVPNGCWSFKLSGTGSSVVCSNLLWPGFTAYAGLGNSSYGYCYFGNGLKNTDIAFML
jgi:radial spoke head protein 9